MIQEGLITASPYKIYLRGHDEVLKVRGIDPGAKLRMDQDIPPMLLKALAVMTALLRSQRGRRYKKRVCRTNRILHGGGVSCSLIASILGVSKSTAWRYRKKLAEMGYIFLQARYSDLVLSVEDLQLSRKFGEADDSWVISGGKARQRLTDRVEINPFML